MHLINQFTYTELQNTINSNSEKENVDFQSYFMHTVHHDCSQIFEKRVKKRVKSAIYAGPVQIFFFKFRRFNRHMERFKFIKFQRSALNILDLVIIFMRFADIQKYS